MLPAFIIIGAMKSGTSSLHNYLNLHPEIGMSRPKELNFFKTETDFAQGLDWYRARFPTGYRVVGESSPNYSKRHRFPGVPERMSPVLPEAALIYLVRDPVERVISQYVHMVATGRDSRPASEVFRDLTRNDYIDTGRYMWQLSQFLKFYREERILVVDTADLLSERAKTLATVFRFLGVDDRFHSAGFDRMHNTDLRRETMLTRAVCRIPGLSSLTSKGLPRRALRKITGLKVRRPLVPAALRYRLYDHYEADTEALERHLGRMFPAWRAGVTT